MESIQSTGYRKTSMIVVSNHVQISESHADTFVQRLKNSYGIEDQPGFVELRLLQPIDAEGYITATTWESMDDYEAWKDGDAFEQAHADRSADETFTAPNEVEIHEIAVKRTAE